MAFYQIRQGSTAYPLIFLMVQSSDHITGATGLTPAVTISKAAGTFSAPAGAVVEIANGWYQVVGNATDSGTLGPLLLHATATGADPADIVYEVVAVDPQSAGFGLSLAKTTNITGFNDIAASSIVTGGAITTSGGKVSGVSLVDTLTTYTGNTPQTGDTYSRVGAPAGASLAADLATVKAKTDLLHSTVSNTVDATVILGGQPATAATVDANGIPVSSLAAVQPAYAPAKAADVVSAVAPVKAKTDSLTFTTAGRVDATVAGVGTGVALANVGPDGNLLISSGTAAGQVNLSSGAVQLAADGLDAIRPEIGYNVRQLLSLLAAAILGDGAGFDTTSPTFGAVGAPGTTRINTTTSASVRTNTLHPPT